MSDFTCIFVYCLTVTAFICIYECKHTTYTAEMCGSFTFSEYLLLQSWSPRGETAKLPQKLLKKNLWSVFKILHNKSIPYLTLLHFPPVLPSVLSVSHHRLSKLAPIPLCCVQTSVRVAFTDLAFPQPLYKHDVTCVPISARLPGRHS